VKPDAFASVMATGIVSIAAADHGYLAISDVLIVLAAVALPALIVAGATALRRKSWGRTPHCAVGARGDGVAGLALAGAGHGPAHVAR
jgi:hypothetical protein